MGIEPMDDSRQISRVAPFREASAIQVREFSACGAMLGNVRQHADPAVLIRRGVTLAITVSG
jgi:hypothetical protein